MNCDDNSITGKLSSLFRKTYKNEKEKEKQYEVFNSELNSVLRAKFNAEIDYFVKKYEKEYIPKLMELFIAAPESNITIFSVKSLKANKIEVGIRVSAKISEEFVEYSKMIFSKDNNTIRFNNSTSFSIEIIDKDCFIIYMITTLKYIKELLGEDIVKEIYEEVYKSCGVKIPDNWDVMKDYYIN